MASKPALPISIEYVAIDVLRPDPRNPRVMPEHERDALDRSIAEFGFLEPVVLQRSTNRIVGGHRRVEALIRQGIVEVPVIFADISNEQADVLSLALNRIHGDWDTKLLARMLADLQNIPDVDVSLTGFDDDEIKNLINSLKAGEKRERLENFDLDEALEQVAPGAVTLGDVWQLDDHRLMCGDATDPAHVAALMGDTTANMAFTDPPYNVDYGNHGGAQRKGRKRKIANDALSPEAWETFVRGWARNLLRFVDGALYICMSTREWPTVSKVLIESGAHWSDTIVWAKDRFTLGRADYQRQYEPIWYGWREGAKRHWCGDRDQGDVWRIDRPSESELHPTMKPLPLIERAIENSSQPGDVVLDLFLGSGSTIIASERTGRACYAMEIDPHYCAVAIARWESFTGQKAELDR